MKVYYNENDPYAAQWLRNLMAVGEIPAGDVDDRSILDVKTDDLKGYHQCHFFAGLGGWSLALRLAGWPEDRPVWTGSCPCQPFSGAGRQKGTNDERHLWPHFLRLIEEWDVPVVFGEQVASRLGRDWLAGVRADLEALGYAVGAADLSAAGAGAPHIRQRLYWVAHNTVAYAAEPGRGAQPERPGLADGRQAPQPGRLRGTGGLGDADDARSQGRDGRTLGRQREAAERAGTVLGRLAEPGEGGRSVVGAARLHEDRASGHDPAGRSAAGGLADTTRQRERPRADQPGQDDRGRQLVAGPESWSDAVHHGGHGFWDDYAIVPCSDGKARRTEPGIFPLAHAGEWGTGSRVGMLRAAGNAIVPPLAATFIRAACPDLEDA